MQFVSHIIIDTIDADIISSFVSLFEVYIYSQHTVNVQRPHTHFLVKTGGDKNINRVIRRLIGPDTSYKNYRIKTLEHFIRGFLYIRAHFQKERTYTSG